MKEFLPITLGFIATVLIVGFMLLYYFGNMLGSSIKMGDGILWLTIPIMVISGALIGRRWNEGSDEEVFQIWWLTWFRLSIFAIILSIIMTIAGVAGDN